jgi:hypothetical protein
MSHTRRGFLKTTATVAAGFIAAASPPPPQRPARQGQNPADSLQDSEIKVPKIKFGKAEISRLIMGCNTLYGYAHFNGTYGSIMSEWYTPEKVSEVLLRCNRLGINTFNYLHSGRGPADLEQFLAKGGKMHLIAQGNVDPEIIVKAVQPLAIYHHGEQTDNAYRAGNMNVVKEYCKKTRQQGVLVGVGSHIPEVLAKVEDEGWDVDFYAGCVYNRRRTPEELRKLMGGELPEMPNEVYLQDDPPRMYKFMKQTKKPCFAFKILAAGRVRSPEPAFKLAFGSIKPTDGIFVGMFPCVKDEVKENAYWTMRHGSVSAAGK